MDACYYCHSPLTKEYFRVESVKCCAACVRDEETNPGVWQRRYYWRGLLWALPACIAASLLIWLADEVFANSSSDTFVHERAGFLYAMVPLLGGAVIAGAAIKAAQRRGSPALQITTLLLTYLAFAMATVPAALYRTPWSQVNAHLVGSLLAAAPLHPWVARAGVPGWLQGPGLLIAFVVGWKTTGVSIRVSGPFDLTDGFSEDRLFKAFGG